MSEDVGETAKQQITTRSGRSFGVGPVGDSGGLLSISGTCPSASAAHLASSPSVEGHEMQLGSEVGLAATTTTESTVPTVARQMDSPVGSPPSSAPREAEPNTGDDRRHELSAGCHSAPGQSDLNGTTGDDTFEASGLSVIAAEHDDDSCDTVVIEPPVLTVQRVSTPSPGQSWASEPQSQPTPLGNSLLQSIKHMMSDMTKDVTCNTRDMLGNIHDKLQKQRSADIADYI